MNSGPKNANNRDYFGSRGLRRALTAGAALSALTLFAACGDQMVGWAAPDDVAPAVTSTTPDDGDIDVALNVAVTATFTEAMAPATINGDSFNVFLGTTEVDGTVHFSGTTAVFTPDQVFEPSANYTATIAQTVTDLAGNHIAAEYTWTFRTGIAVDGTPPMVSDTTPGNDDTDVVVNTTITATFTEEMDAATISDTTFTVVQGATTVTGAVTYVGVTATFDPDADLDANTRYVVTIANEASDLAGNGLNADYIWEFTTGDLLDEVAPLVTSTVPDTDAIDVPLNAPVTANFNEAMDPATMTVANFGVSDGSDDVAGTVGFAGTTVSFMPSAELDADTTYTATITTDVADLAGNTLATQYEWSFTTGNVPDTFAPSVTFTVPTDDATGVTLGTSVAAVFSEPMDPSTINIANFTVQQLGAPIAGTVTYTALTATFNPTLAFTPNTTYAATITTVATDLAGNSLRRNYVWNFTTGFVGDTTRPLVVSTIPLDLATNVAIDTNVTATFSESMDPLTVNDLSFTLMDGITPVDGSVLLVGSTAIFNPDVELDADTEYTATITNVAADLSGNTIASNYVWTFTTGILLDELDPEVILTNPLDLAINVAVDSTVNATFSEAMDPLTITNATFTVEAPGGADVDGTVEYDVLTMTATFTPGEDLQINTLYTATVAVLASDLAGNTIFEDYVWTFTTGEIIGGLAPVDLGSLTTFVAVAGAGLTNSNVPTPTILNGDVGLFPTATCMGDGSPCSIVNPIINGTLYAADPGGVAARAKTDLVAAFVDAMGRPPGTSVTDISGMRLAPGVYTAPSSLTVAVGQNVTLDGQGNPNAVWIFQVGSSITINNSVQILLINGARAKNVFWAAGASSTIGNNVNFQGTVMAGESNSIETGSTVIGRLLCTSGQITLLSNTITLPPL